MHIDTLKDWWAQNSKGLKHLARTPSGHAPVAARKPSGDENQPGEPHVMMTQPNGAHVYAFKTKAERDGFLKDWPHAKACDDVEWDVRQPEPPKPEDAGE